MKVIKQNSKLHHILVNGGSLPSRDALAEWLTSWRKKLGYFSVFAALPAIFASHATEARADEVKQPQPSVAGPTAKFPDRLNSCGSKPDFLKRQSEYRLPHQKGSFDILSLLGGNDDCPGRAIPLGTYTAAAPYIDSGDTTGANDTVSVICGGYYCYYSSGAAGPDQIYTFTLSARGANPQIQVTATSGTYDPLIYLLDSNISPGCPSGTNNFGYDLYWLTPHSTGSTENINLSNAPLNRRLYLFIDSEYTDARSSGSYTIRIQDVTIAPALSERKKFDFDGDGRSDVSVFRPTDSVWYLNRSTQGFTATQFGLSSDKIVPADYDGDGKTDLAVFRPVDSPVNAPDFHILQSSNNTIRTEAWGITGDIPVSGDYDGDGRAEVGVFRPSESKWYVGENLSGIFGQAGDLPLTGDFDGDDKTDIAVYRPSTGVWWLRRSSSGDVAFQFGISTDKPVPGDYTGDGLKDVAVWRPSTGEWFVLRSEDLSYYSLPFGLSTDIPAPADYDGDGKTDIAVYRNGVWYILQSLNGAVSYQYFGLTSDKPVPAAYLP